MKPPAAMRLKGATDDSATGPKRSPVQCERCSITVGWRTKKPSSRMKTWRLWCSRRCIVFLIVVYDITVRTSAKQSARCGCVSLEVSGQVMRRAGFGSGPIDAAYNVISQIVGRATDLERFRSTPSPAVRMRSAK